MCADVVWTFCGRFVVKRPTSLYNLAVNDSREANKQEWSDGSPNMQIMEAALKIVVNGEWKRALN